MVNFQWSAEEQLYPFEKTADGKALYCKEIDFGALPNNGSKEVAHNIPNFSVSQLHRTELDMISVSASLGMSDTQYNWGTSTRTETVVKPAVVRVANERNFSDFTAKIKLYYTK